MEFILVLSLLLLFVASLILLRGSRRIGTRSQPPGPRGLPIIGNLHQIDPINRHISLGKLAEKYGPIMLLRFFAKPVLIISSEKLARQVLKVQDLVFCSRPKFVSLQKFTYNGSDVAFAPYGDSWKGLRKFCITHLLSNIRVQSFRPVREDEVFEMVKLISNMGERGEVVHLSKIMMSLVSKLICRIAFGRKFDESEKMRFDEIMSETQAMLGGLFVTDYLPRFGWIDNLSGMNARLEKAFTDLDKFYQELINEHLDLSRTKPSNPDILDLMIQLKEDKSFSIDITWDHIKGILMNIFIGASGTSEATITWVMTALMQNPDAMNKLQVEIRGIVKERGKVTEEDIPKLVYLKAVIKETLRLYPPGPLLLPRESLQDCFIEGYEVKSRTLVYINAWAIARDPEFWENPNDFLPERFLDSEVDIVGQDFHVFPFGSGRRICAGITMGLVTVELAVANLVYAFDWELAYGMKIEDIDTEIAEGLLMHKKNELCLVPKKYIYSSV